MEARTARAWKVPHTVLRGRPDDGRWEDADRLMALALTAYEASLCGQCGMPASLVHGDHNVGRYEAKEDICHGCEELEAARADTSRDDYPGRKFHLHEA